MLLLLIPAALATTEAMPPDPGPVAEGVPLPYWEGEIEPGYHARTLANGLRVSVLSDPDLPVVATQIWVHVGGAHERADERGFAHLFEHMMFGNTTEHSKEDYARLHTVNGGSENAYTSWDETVYVSEIAPEAHHWVLELEADRFQHLAITEENLENEKKIVTEELRLRTENDPFSRLLISGLDALFADHPYSLTPAGTHEDIANVTVDLPREFYGAYYRPGNLHLVIAGPVDGERTLDAVEDLFGPIATGGTTAPEIPPVMDIAFPEHIALSEDLPPMEIAAWVYPLPAASSPDTPAIQVMQQILSGGEVDLFRQALVVDRDKALEAGSGGMQLRAGGILGFFSLALPYRREKTAQRLIGEVITELDRLDWLTEESLATARRALLREHLRGQYSAASLADDIGNAAWHLGDEQRAFTAADEIAGVTRDDVAGAWQRYVRDATPVKLYVEPEKVPIGIRLFGWLAPVVM